MATNESVNYNVINEIRKKLCRSINFLGLCMTFRPFDYLEKIGFHVRICDPATDTIVIAYDNVVEICRKRENPRHLDCIAYPLDRAGLLADMIVKVAEAYRRAREEIEKTCVRRVNIIEIAYNCWISMVLNEGKIYDPKMCSECPYNCICTKFRDATMKALLLVK